MAGVRFSIPGVGLFVWAAVRGAPMPGARIWYTCGISGLLMFMGGNGTVVWAEQFVPSGMVALLVATVPLWIVLQDWGSGRGPAPGLRLSFGIAWGFLGVTLLVTGSEIALAGPQDLMGGLLVLGGAACWSAGSLVSRYGARPRSAAQGNGIQMLAGGISLTLWGLMRGEAGNLDAGAISTASALALLYLIVFGSLIGFSAYIWLFRNTTPAVAATYAYVNPGVALLLGWALAGEPLSARTGLAAFVILSAVVVITTTRTPAKPGGSDGSTKVYEGSVREETG
jgi:drug/metabolite transporter (DMT)-like permease